MASKLINHQVKFHLDKACHLEKEMESRKVAGENRILKMENELRRELDRIQEQINSHKNKAEVLSAIMNA